MTFLLFDIKLFIWLEIKSYRTHYNKLSSSLPMNFFASTSSLRCVGLAMSPFVRAVSIQKRLFFPRFCFLFHSLVCPKSLYSIPRFMPCIIAAIFCSLGKIKPLLSSPPLSWLILDMASNSVHPQRGFILGV